VYKFSSEAFTLFEVYFRYILVFVSVIITMMFWVQNRFYHTWNQWALEQKWTFILLVSVVMFNNPIFFLNIYAEHWIFPLLNTVFVNTFLTVYMLCILLFTDNLYKSHRRLSNTEFYLPKLVLLGSLWLVGIVSFVLTRAKQKDDIAQNDIEDVQVEGFEVLKIMVGIMVTIYFLWLFYLICRVLSQWTHDSFAHISRRIKVLWFAALLMVPTIILGLFVLVLERNETMEAVQFFGFFALYNCWTFFLSYMYWPVNVKAGGAHFAPPKMGPSNNQPHAAAVAAAEADMDAIFDDEEDI
jgi:hypothetical protein